MVDWLTIVFLMRPLLHIYRNKLLNYNEAKCCIALTLIPGVGPVSIKRALEYVGSAVQVFASLNNLVEQELIKPSQAEELQNTIYLDRSEKILNEYLVADVKVIPYTSDLYPYRLRQCDDAPPILFFKGNVDLNRTRIVNIVGTRNVTNYGLANISRLVQEIAHYDSDILVVSGLAYGVDIAAHINALENGLDTIGVLAHGLDRIYPYSHRHQANKMLSQGGLLTEFLPKTEPERYNFVSRNRIIAGISDATIIIESAYKGGALITGEFANDYNRDCFALPGRVSDEFSLGCNKLIKENRAYILTAFNDVIEALNWDINKTTRKSVVEQKRIFGENLSEEELLVLKLLEVQGATSVDNIENKTNINISELHTMLFKLEMEGLIQALAGNAYQLL